MGRRVMLMLFAFALVWSATEQQKILDEYSGKASPNSWIIQQPNRKPLPASYLPPGGMLLMTMDPAMMTNEDAAAAAVPASSSEKPLDEPSVSSQSPEELIPPVEEEDPVDSQEPAEEAIPADSVPEVSPTIAEESDAEDPPNIPAIPESSPPVEEESTSEDPPVVQEPAAVNPPVEEESTSEDSPVVQEPAAVNPPVEEESTAENPPAVQEPAAVVPPVEEESTSEDQSSVQEPVDVKPTDEEESTPEDPAIVQEPAAVSPPVAEEPTPEDPFSIQESVDVKPTTDADEGSSNDISSVAEEEQQPAPADPGLEAEAVENQVHTEEDNELASLVQEDPEPLPTTVISEDVIFVTTQVYNTDSTNQGVAEQATEQTTQQLESIGDFLGQQPTAVNEGSGGEGSGNAVIGLADPDLAIEPGFIPFEAETTTTSVLESETDAPQGSNSIDLEINDPEEDQLAQLRRNLLSVKEEEEVSGNEAAETVEGDGDEEARQYQRRPYPIRPGAGRPPQRNGGLPHQNYHPDDAYFMSRTYEYCYTLWCKFKTGLKSVGLL